MVSSNTDLHNFKGNIPKIDMTHEKYTTLFVQNRNMTGNCSKIYFYAVSSPCLCITSNKITWTNKQTLFISNKGGILLKIA